ncbi:MAG: hypothetical protein EAX91_11400 [Candidatus Lokiarchaeota archaeon]|nr:hypothetical protein [Candidatus Lokiarchaeota archaeon]
MVGRSQLIFYKCISWDFTATSISVFLTTIVSKIRQISNFIGFKIKISIIKQIYLSKNEIGD